MKLKNVFCSFMGLVGTTIINALGGYDIMIETLLFFMVVDYLTGLYIAGVLHKSPKTKSGGLSSTKGYHGLVKKVMVLVLVAVMYRVDLLFDIDYLRNGSIIAFCFQEGISIIENAGLMGVAIPDVVKRGIDLLNREVDDNEN
jgi:toxin secretion/phage lysis holin